MPDIEKLIEAAKLELAESDIPISYQTYMSMLSSSASGTGASGQQVVREVVVLRPVAGEKSG